MWRNLIFVLTVIVVLVGCQKSYSDVTISHYDLGFAVPSDWTLILNDTSNSGTLCILAKTESDGIPKPTICLWFGGYSFEPAKNLGTNSLELMLITALSGAIITKYEKIKISTDINFNQKTKHKFLDFNVSDSDAKAAVSLIDSENMSEIDFIITLAAHSKAIEETKNIADELVTIILSQLNDSE